MTFLSSFDPGLAPRSAKKTALNTRSSSERGMEKSCGNIREGLRFSPRGFASFLRRRYPRATADSVAADLGVGKRTAEGWLSGESRPTADAMVRAVAIYGLAALAAAMTKTPDFLDEAVRSAEAARIRAEIADLETRLRRI